MLGRPVEHRALNDRIGDLFAHFDHVATGDVVVCASSFGDMLESDEITRMLQHDHEQAIHCEHVAHDAARIEIDVPPQPRFK